MRKPVDSRLYDLICSHVPYLIVHEIMHKDPTHLPDGSDLCASIKFRLISFAGDFDQALLRSSSRLAWILSIGPE